MPVTIKSFAHTHTTKPRITGNTTLTLFPFNCCDLAGGGTLLELETPPREFGGAGAEAGAEVAVLPTFETFPALDVLLLTAGVDPVRTDTLAATGGGTARAINCCSLSIEGVPLVAVVPVPVGARAESESDKLKGKNKENGRA